ncbi:hypothetical protein D9M69_493870 [compost metagenome]
MQDAAHQIEELGIDRGAVAEIGTHRCDYDVLIAPQLGAQRPQLGLALGQRGLRPGTEGFALALENAGHALGGRLLDHAWVPLV